MNEQKFEQLWQRAEAESHASRLAGEYPAWRTRRRRTAGMAAVAAVMLAVAVPALAPHHSSYGNVYCNRTGMAEKQWVDLASDMLLDA